MENNKKSLNPLLIVAAVVVIGLIAWPLVYGKNKNTQNPESKPTISESMMEPTSSNQMMEEAGSIKVEGGKFYFKPNEIRVKKGEKVKIIFTNAEGLHDFVIDEFAVKTDRISDGQTTEVEFTPDKTGTFEFYCSVPNHRQMGMKGNLIVE